MSGSKRECKLSANKINAGRALDKGRAPRYNYAMLLTDIHTHSTWSADADSPLEDMVQTARQKGLAYFGVSEHFDYDYIPAGLTYNGSPVRTDEEGYFAQARALQRQLNDKNFTFLAGCELGYTDDPATQNTYSALIQKFSPDFVVNSVHTCDGYDCWFGDYFDGKDKNYAYSRYLERVLSSLSAPYRYDIVAHIGYVSRNAPYAYPKLRYSDFAALYDAILTGIISRGKILEVNSSSRGAGSAFLPDTDVLARYFELGGREVSFASDAHFVGRICAGREEVVSALKSVGFEYITVPCRGERIKVPI